MQERHLDCTFSFTHFQFHFKPARGQPLIFRFFLFFFHITLGWIEVGYVSQRVSEVMTSLLRLSTPQWEGWVWVTTVPEGQTATLRTRQRREDPPEVPSWGGLRAKAASRPESLPEQLPAEALGRAASQTAEQPRLLLEACPLQQLVAQTLFPLTRPNSR